MKVSDIIRIGDKIDIRVLQEVEQAEKTDVQACLLSYYRDGAQPSGADEADLCRYCRNHQYDHSGIMYYILYRRSHRKSGYAFGILAFLSFLILLASAFHRYRL